MDVTRMCLRATFDIQKRIYIPFCHMRFMSVSRTFQLLLLERITFDTHKRQRFFDHFVLTDMSARVRVRVSETKARTWGAASTSSSCLANPNPNPNTKSNYKSNLSLVPIASYGETCRLRWKCVIVRSLQPKERVLVRKHTHKHFSESKNLRADISVNTKCSKRCLVCQKLCRHSLQ